MAAASVHMETLGLRRAPFSTGSAREIQIIPIMIAPRNPKATTVAAAISLEVSSIGRLLSGGFGFPPETKV